MRVTLPVALRTQPRVSVVIPHYNYGQYLPAAVASALDHDGLDLEVIIVDDCSTDGSTAIARRLSAEDDRVQLVEHATNMRHIRTYNDGLSRATGEYVVLLSADDLLTPNSLTRSVALMEAHREVGLVYGRVGWFHGDADQNHGTERWWQIWSGRDWLKRMATRGRNSIVNPEVVMRKSVYDDIGGYDPDFPHAGDLLMWLQAAARADIGYVGGVRQALYRDHGANMHSTYFVGMLDDMRQVRGAYDHLFSSDDALIGDEGAAALRSAAMDAVAREALLRGGLLAAGARNAEVLTLFRQFAQETSARASRSPAYRWTAMATAAGPRGARLFRSVESLRWKVRFRRNNLVGF